MYNNNRFTRYRRTNNYPYRQGVKRKSSASQRATGNIRSAFQQKDTAEVVINCNNVISCKVQADLNNSVGAINVFDALRKSSFFNYYAPMYDQVKIDKIKAKFTSLQFPNFQGSNNTTNNFTVITAFDRNGLDEGQVELVNGANGNKDLETRINEELGTYSSALTKNLTFGSTFDIIRYITPSSIAEKSQYVATDSLKKWYDGGYDVQYNQYKSVILENGVPKYIDRNPCSLTRDETIPFKPTYLVGIKSLIRNGTDANATLGENKCTFNIEMDICCTFRGLRKSNNV